MIRGYFAYSKLVRDLESRLATCPLDELVESLKAHPAIWTDQKPLKRRLYRMFLSRSYNRKANPVSCLPIALAWFAGSDPGSQFIVGVGADLKAAHAWVVHGDGFQFNTDPSARFERIYTVKK